MDTETKKKLLFGELPAAHQHSSSRLIQYIRGVGGVVSSVVASKWVLRQLQSVIDLQDIRKLYKLCATLHRVIELWAFEELVLKTLGTMECPVCLRLDGTAGVATAELWPSTPVITFSHRDFFRHNILRSSEGAKIRVENDIVLRPDICNNESWDAVRVFKDQTTWRADFLEVTLQDKHQATETVLGMAFQILRATTELDINPQVRHIGIVDGNVFDAFTFRVTPYRPRLPRRAKDEDESAEQKLGSNPETTLPVIGSAFEARRPVLNPENVLPVIGSACIQPKFAYFVCQFEGLLPQ